jgi:hypothetical protein
MGTSISVSLDILEEEKHWYNIVKLKLVSFVIVVFTAWQPLVTAFMAALRQISPAGTHKSLPRPCGIYVCCMCDCAT